MAGFTAFAGETDFHLLHNGYDEFVERCKLAAFQSVDEMRQIGERRARVYAPVKTTALRGAMRSRMRSRTEGEVSNAKPYALPQELGASPHPITGFLNFFWEKIGRMFVWNNPAYNNWNEAEGATVRHPGNRAHPYIRPALRYAISQWRRILPRYYP